MINHMTLQGRLTRDPDLRQTKSGVSVCSFTVAWSEKRKDTETKLFMPCTAWRSTADMISRNFSKGREIAVEGKLSTRDWTDNDGNKRSAIEMSVDLVHFCGPKPADVSNDTERSALPKNDFAEITDDGGELPF